MNKKVKRKPVIRDKRIGMRVTEELYNAINIRAVQNHKKLSEYIVDLIVKDLHFEQPIEKK